MSTPLQSADAPGRWTFTVSRNTLTLAVALWVMLTMNFSFWRTVWEGAGGWSNGSKWFLLSLPLLVLCWLFGLLSLLSWGRATKVLLGLLLLVSAVTSYSLFFSGGVIDSSTLPGVLHGDFLTSGNFLGWQLYGWMLLLGVLPLWLLSRARLLQRGWKRELSAKLGGLVLALVCIAGIAGSSYQSYSSLLRNHREIRQLLVPSNVLAVTHGFLKRKLVTATHLEVVGGDAYRLLPGGKPKVSVLVVGETARAANFSLNGYARNTNPELARRDVLNFTSASSCGTAPAVSLPCMFQNVGRLNFAGDMAESREGLLDVLQRAGVEVLWRDNNGGCKEACNRVPFEDVSHFDVAAFCNSEACYDEVLLQGLQAYLDGLEGDATIVLHMRGSQGPAYFKDYPATFEKFSPACNNSQFDRCTQESIVNAYDNTLRYTDHVLASIIDLLQHNARRLDSAMLYLSDSGESLGENGLYLHGLPYAVAPQEQTHIPMIMWLSSGMQTRQSIAVDCLASKQQSPVSQDNLFHSVLGLMDVHTRAYQADLDLFRSCRPGAEGPYAQHLLQAQRPVD